MPATHAAARGGGGRGVGDDHPIADPRAGLTVTARGGRGPEGAGRGTGREGCGSRDPRRRSGHEKRAAEGGCAWGVLGGRLGACSLNAGHASSPPHRDQHQREHRDVRRRWDRARWRGRCPRRARHPQRGAVRSGRLLVGHRGDPAGDGHRGQRLQRRRLGRRGPVRRFGRLAHAHRLYGGRQLDRGLGRRPLHRRREHRLRGGAPSHRTARWRGAASWWTVGRLS